MFRAFGHNRSSILDGGLLGWQAHGQGTKSGPAENGPSSSYPAPQLKEGVVKGRLNFDLVTAPAFLI